MAEVDRPPVQPFGLRGLPPPFEQDAEVVHRAGVVEVDRPPVQPFGLRGLPPPGEQDTRDKVIALLPYYAGLRIGEVVTRTRTTKIVYCPSSPENSFRSVR